MWQDDLPNATIIPPLPAGFILGPASDPATFSATGSISLTQHLSACYGNLPNETGPSGCDPEPVPILTRECCVLKLPFFSSISALFSGTTSVLRPHLVRSAQSFCYCSIAFVRWGNEKKPFVDSPQTVGVFIHLSITTGRLFNTNLHPLPTLPLLILMSDLNLVGGDNVAHQSILSNYANRNMFTAS